jgi:hypothetical protein
MLPSAALNKTWLINKNKHKSLCRNYVLVFEIRKILSTSLITFRHRLQRKKQNFAMTSLSRR